MKVLSVIVPSYNSEAYLNHCLNTILDSGEGIEVIVVNDGSKDNTAEIAEDYVARYPDRVRAIHQENAGHGGAVMTGIKAAKGKYIKVVDSDDWVNPDVLNKIVAKLKSFILNDEDVDMFISDFMYDKVDYTHKKIMSFEGILPEDRIFTWNDTNSFPTGKYMLMHSVIYSKNVLEKSKLTLPKHTFYVDNLFVYLPLPHVEKLYYLHECLYHYYIGRDEQSVSEKNMIRRIDQQLNVNRTMIDQVNLGKVKNRKKRKYMIHYLNIVTVVSTVFLYKKGTSEALHTKHKLWKDIKSSDWKSYYRMRRTLLGNIVHIPGFAGRKASMYAYKKAQEKIGFN